MHVRRIIASLLGAFSALLLARLLLRLLAARPDNPAFSALFAITTPPAFFGWLDQAQPRFGATLEFSTLALFLLCIGLSLIVGRAGRASASRA